MGSVEPRGQGRKDVPVNQRRGPSSSEKAGKSRADGNDFSTFSMKYKAQSLLKIMRDALVRINRIMIKDNWLRERESQLVMRREAIYTKAVRKGFSR